MEGVIDMKYWKRGAVYGTMDDNGNVPGSVQATKADYDAWLATQPAPEPQTDYPADFAAASTIDAKINVLAKVLKLV